MTGRRLFGALLTALVMITGCTREATEDVHVERLEHACALLEKVDTEELVGFASARMQPNEEGNEQYDVRISQCDHYGEDMAQRFSLVVRQDFSNRKLESGRQQLEALRQKLSEFAQDGVDWRFVESMGEAAAWNGTANQLTVYEDKGHTTLAFSVYGTGDDESRALALARAAMEHTPYAQQ